MGLILTLRYAQALDFLLGFANLDIAGDDGRKLGGGAETADECRQTIERREPRLPTEPRETIERTDLRWPRERQVPERDPRGPRERTKKLPPPAERKIPDKPVRGGSWFGDE